MKIAGNWGAKIIKNPLVGRFFTFADAFFPLQWRVVGHGRMDGTPAPSGTLAMEHKPHQPGAAKLYMI